MSSDLVISALSLLWSMRVPNGGGGLIHHSGQGVFNRSMDSVGDAYDNAMADSFIASLECELPERAVLKTKSAARTELFSYIEGRPNSKSALDDGMAQST